MCVISPGILWLHLVVSIFIGFVYDICGAGLEYSSGTEVLVFSG
jgi:hypothetical protein